MILNTPPQAGAYRLYVPSLLHMHLIGEGPPERVCQRSGEGLTEKACRRRSAGEDSSEKIRQRRSDVEGSLERVHRRRPVGEGLLEKVRRRRWLTLESTMTLIPCEMREEKNNFLY